MTDNDDGTIALKILVDMFFQQFLTVSQFMCPMILIETGKENFFRKFLLDCLRDNLSELNEKEGEVNEKGNI